MSSVVVEFVPSGEVCHAPKMGDDEVFTGRSKTAVARRLALTRDALGLSQIDFATKANIAKSTYNQYETATNLPNIQAAQALADAHDLTLDWIYNGDNSGLDLKTRRTIQALYDLRADKGNADSD